MTLRGLTSAGKFVSCAIALIVGGLAMTPPTSAAADDSPMLRGDAALDELARRGVLKSLLAAVNAARGNASSTVGDEQDGSIMGPAYLKASNTGSDSFAGAVAVSGDTVVVGAAAEDGGGMGVNPPSDEAVIGAGAAYVFVRSGGGWIQQAYLKASNPGSFDGFGGSVAIAGDIIVVGAQFEDGSGTGVNPASNELATESGAAYVFIRNGGVWSVSAYLKASNTGAGDRFGLSGGVSGNTIVVGAAFEDGSASGVNHASSELASNAGAAYAFERHGATWVQSAYLKASSTMPDERFGAAVGVSGDWMVIGASGEDGNGVGVNPVPNELAANSGAANVFTRSGTSWRHHSELKASNAGMNDSFGLEVAIAGTTIVVGAIGEDGSGTGVNTPSDEGASGSGAAYVFALSGNTWTQQAYLKASNTQAGDDFGGSVGVSGNRVVVGAYAEDGGGSGVNPASDENTVWAGAAYVFTRHGSTWSQEAYLKASNPDGFDRFGISAAVSEHFVMVGADNEAGSGTGVNPPSSEGLLGAGAAYVFDLPSESGLIHLDQDSTGDVVLYDSSAGGWSRQLGLQTGTFTEQSHGVWPAGQSVSSARFNSDALTDFFLFDSATGAWATLLADGPWFTTQASGNWWPGWQRHVMDLNGDGLSDVFLYDPVTGHWFKCVSSATGFTYSQGAWSPGWEIHPMNLNGDKLRDMFLFSRTTGRWFWVLGQDSGGFTYPVSETWGMDWQFHPGDFNGDGLTDLLLHDPVTGASVVATTGPGGFSYAEGGWSQGLRPHVADFNADAMDDVLLHDAATGRWFQMISDGAGTFTNAGGETWALSWSLHFTDVDGDGRADILLYDAASGAWSLGRNFVNGSFTHTAGSWAAGLFVVTRAPVR